MIANYGYEDGSGYYYITIDGDVCAKCESRACLTACPAEVYAVEIDDYDDMVAVVAEKSRRRLRELCAGCKGQNGGGDVSERDLPCTSACPGAAIRHSW
jgi:ferredoxin-like protein FixX